MNDHEVDLNYRCVHLTLGLITFTMFTFPIGVDGGGGFVLCFQSRNDRQIDT